MSVSLATGLLAIHCMIPPHPGAAAAAATFERSRFWKININWNCCRDSCYDRWLYCGLTMQVKKFLSLLDEEIIADAIAKPPSVIKAFLL